MDYFLIELIQTIRLSSAAAIARAKKVEQEMAEAGLVPPSSLVPPALPLKRDPGGSISTVPSRDPTGKTKELDEETEGVRARLEAIGLHVGANFTERYVV
jgi:hypothetical protein